MANCYRLVALHGTTQQNVILCGVVWHINAWSCRCGVAMELFQACWPIYTCSHTKFKFILSGLRSGRRGTRLKLQIPRHLHKSLTFITNARVSSRAQFGVPALPPPENPPRTCSSASSDASASRSGPIAPSLGTRGSNSAPSRGRRRSSIRRERGTPCARCTARPRART